MRSVEEWVGKSDDAAIPPRVRLRVFEKHGGLCALSGRKIMPGDKWELDHIKPLWAGGEHRESNLQPALKAPHKEKSAADQSVQAKSDRIKKKHLGIWPKSKAKIKSRGFGKPSLNKTEKDDG